MKRTYDHEKKPSQSTASFQPKATYLQTRGFAPLQTDLDESAPSRPSGYTENFLEKIINQRSTQSSSPDTAVQAKPMNRLQTLQAKRMSMIQAKLNIGEPNDKYEQEADATASKVVQQINSTPQDQSIQREDSMEDNALQMKPISFIQREDSMEEEDELQMKSLVQRRENLNGGEASTDLESSIQSARGGGQSLDAGLQEKMGQAMGADFSGVKVHTDSQSDQLNKSIQAKAFTTGQDVFFQQGAYEPSSRGGQELIAHELTHVIQQNTTSLQRKPVSGNKESNISKLDQPTINRFVVAGQQSPLPIAASTTRVDWSSFGAVGVGFFHDGNSPLVVKPDSGRGDIKPEAVFGSTLHQKIAGAQSPSLRPAVAQELTDILQVLNDPNITDWDNLNDSRPNPYPSGKAMKDIYITLFGGALISEQGQGDNFAEIKKQSEDNDTALDTVKNYLSDPNYLVQIGKIHAVDLFFGNADRFECANLSNWLTDGNRRIVAIDNLGDESKFGQDFDDQATLYKGLKDSALDATANKVVNKLLSQTSLNKDNTWVQQNRAIMKANILSGLKQGKKKLLSKLAPRIGKRSRTIKGSVVGAGGNQGNTMWDNVKRRAKQLRSL